jgi:hypothetical protein
VAPIAPTSEDVYGTDDRRRLSHRPPKTMVAASG